MIYLLPRHIKNFSTRRRKDYSLEKQILKENKLITIFNCEYALPIVLLTRNMLLTLECFYDNCKSRTKGYGINMGTSVGLMDKAISENDEYDNKQCKFNDERNVALPSTTLLRSKVKETILYDSNISERFETAVESQMLIFFFAMNVLHIFYDNTTRRLF